MRMLRLPTFNSIYPPVHRASIGGKTYNTLEGLEHAHLSLGCSISRNFDLLGLGDNRGLGFFFSVRLETVSRCIALANFPCRTDSTIFGKHEIFILPSCMWMTCFPRRVGLVKIGGCG